LNHSVSPKELWNVIISLSLGYWRLNQGLAHVRQVIYHFTPFLSVFCFWDRVLLTLTKLASDSNKLASNSKFLLLLPLQWLGLHACTTRPGWFLGLFCLLFFFFL
jgi:hypothetical protein